jgi:hypothetical protein
VRDSNTCSSGRQGGCNVQLQEAAFQLYRPIIARVIPPTPEPAKVDTKPEDGEVAAEEGEIEVPKPAAPEPGAVNDARR